MWPETSVYLARVSKPTPQGLAIFNAQGVGTFFLWRSTAM